MDKKSKKCPICKNDMLLFNRYPNRICNKCSELTVTEEKKNIYFGNIDIYGGFMSIVDGNIGDIHECYVNDIKCYAEEGRFGGIIISKV